ncbi:hypothetical protein SDJN03_27756, partial [Cucurbita argyrosperma subsp. sororia]
MSFTISIPFEIIEVNALEEVDPELSLTFFRGFVLFNVPKLWTNLRYEPISIIYILSLLGAKQLGELP